MNTKLNNSKSRIILLTNGLPTNFQQQGLKNILISTSKPTKYIVTLKPRTNLKNQNNSKLETRKVFINADDVPKGKSMFDTKLIATTTRLEKIDEQSENSVTSIISDKYDLKIPKSKTYINRLRGGWGKGNRRLSRKKSNAESKSGLNDNNGQADTPEETDSVRESRQFSLDKDTNTLLVKTPGNTNLIIKNEDKQQKETIADNDSEKVEANVSITENQKDIKEGIELEKKFELKKSVMDNNVPTTSSSETKEYPKALITFSFIDNVLEDIIPLTEKQRLLSNSAKCELKDIIPICGKSKSSQTQCDLLGINKKEATLASELFCMLQCDKETCKRIDNLEAQVHKFNVELKDLQKDLIPLDDLAKFKVISKHFNEVNNLLMDLKQNCLKLQTIELQKDEGRETSPCPCFGMCNCDIYQRFPTESEQYINECEYPLDEPTSECIQRSNFVNCPHCIPIIQESSVYDIQHNLSDFKTPEIHMGCSCCDHCQFCTQVNIKPQSSSSNTISYQKRDERSLSHRGLAVTYDISLENSPRKEFNRNTSQITSHNNQMNIDQKPFRKSNSSTSQEYIKRPRNSAGRDNSSSLINKETKTDSNIMIQDRHAELPTTTDNLCQDNNFQLSSKHLIKQIQSLNNKSHLKRDIIKNKPINMPDPNETYSKIKSVRLKNLEQQVHLMYGELHRIRDGMLTHRDLRRLGNLLERLRELNAIIVELRNHYMQQSTYGTPNDIYTRQQDRDNNGNISKGYEKQNERQNHSTNFVMNENSGKYSWSDKNENYYPRENAGFDRRESSDNTHQQENNKEKHLNQDTEQEVLKEGNKDLANGQLKTCQQLMNEIKPPGSILGNYLIRLQDFRTDPELRRQRWEKKQQEKLQQLQKRKYIMESLNDKGTSTEVTPQHKSSNLNEQENFSSSKTDSSLIENDHKGLVKTIINVNSIKPNSETDSGLALDLPLIKNNLSEVVYEIINDIDKDTIALTIVLENDHLYHISVSLISSGHSLSCFLATDEAIQEAKRHHLFQDILTFFVVNAEYSEEQKDRILGHSFEFIKTNVK